MGNKLVSSPFPSYDSAISLFNPAELTQLRNQFNEISQSQPSITYERFSKSNPRQSDYVRKRVLPRVFNTLDTKKDGIIDWEEYISAIAVFRHGTIEDKIKCLYLMYDGNKSGASLSKENFRQLMVDSTICVQQADPPSVKELEQWIQDLHQLSMAMVETALIQYSAHANKLDIQEFIAFVKVEGTIQGLMHLIPTLVDR